MNKVITGAFHRVRLGHAKRFASESSPEPVRRPARVAVMLALACAIRNAIDRGDIRDQAEVARRLGLTRARLSQLLDLTLLAPDLQETILFLEAVDGLEPLSERALRGLTQLTSWAQQRERWTKLQVSAALPARDGPSRRLRAS